MEGEPVVSSSPEETKRVLFIAPQPFFQWRGSPIRVGFNLLALSQSGYQVDLLTLPFGEDKSVPGVRIIRVGNLFGLKNIPIGPSVWKIFFNIRLFFKGLDLIRGNSYSIVCAVEDAGLIGVILARKAKARLVFEKHSDPGSYRKNGLRNLVMLIYGKVEAWVIRRADAVIGTGPGLVEQARRIAPDKPCHHIFDIPSSLVEPDPVRARALRAELCPEKSAVIVAYVGSFAVYQGVELLFAAIPIVARRAPRVHFVIIGGTDDEIRRRTAALQEQDAGHAVTFAGKLPPDELPDYLAACDILLSSRIAGTNTPLKLLDYLKVGRCILATDNTANRQILDDDSALFVHPDPESFADGICRLADDETLRERLASAGHKLVRDTYNFTEFKKRISRVYGSLC